MSRAEALGRNVLWFTLFVSLAGFLGYYDADGFVTPPPAIVLGLQVVGGLLAAVLLRDRLILSLRGIVPLLLVAIWAAATLIWADDPVTAMRRWVLVFAPGLLLCALAASDPRPRQTFVWFTGVVFAIAVASGIFSLTVLALSDRTVVGEAMRFVLVDTGDWTYGVAEGGRQYLDIGFYIPRFSGLTSNPNSLGLFAAIGIVSAVAFTPTHNSRANLVAALAVTILVIILLLSASRAAFAMVGAGVLFAALLRLKLRHLALFLILLTVAMTVALYAVAWSSGAPSESGSAEVLELRERSDVWQLALAHVPEYWMIGTGFGIVQEAVFVSSGLTTSAHSIPLSIVLEIGVIGLALVLTAWLGPAVKLSRLGGSLDPLAIAYAALLVGLFVHQAVDSSVFRYHWAHFVFVYVIGASAGLSGSRTSE